MVKKILLLGNPALYEIAREATPDDDALIAQATEDLHDTLMDYRARYGAGRAVAAPQIGVPLRMIYMNTGTPVVMLNPLLEFPDGETVILDDDCMSFPGLYVRVRRYVRCVVRYHDANWQPGMLRLEGDLAELIQHEYDHLDGILATMRAVDEKAFAMAKAPEQGPFK